MRVAMDYREVGGVERPDARERRGQEIEEQPYEDLIPVVITGEAGSGDYRGEQALKPMYDPGQIREGEVKEGRGRSRPTSPVFESYIHDEIRHILHDRAVLEDSEIPGLLKSILRDDYGIERGTINTLVRFHQWVLEMKARQMRLVQKSSVLIGMIIGLLSLSVWFVTSGVIEFATRAVVASLLSIVAFGFMAIGVLELIEGVD